MFLFICLVSNAIIYCECIQHYGILNLIPYTEICTFPTENCKNINISNAGLEDAFKYVETNPYYADYFALDIKRAETKCDPARATKELFEYINDDVQSSMTSRLFVLGPFCSNVVLPLAYALPFWNMFQIGYASQIPQLSNADTYETFYRTVPSITSLHEICHALLLHFNWTSVAILLQEGGQYSVYSELFSAFMSDTKESGIDYDVITFQDKSDIEIALKDLQALKLRIFLGFFDLDFAENILCHAKSLGLVNGRHIWALTGNMESPSAETLKCAQGSFLLSISKDISDHYALNSMTFNRSRFYTSNYLYSYSFDAVLLVAETFRYLTVNEINATSNASVISQILENNNFTGMTGEVSFKTSNVKGVQLRERIGSYSISQFIDNEIRPVGIYHAVNCSLVFHSSVYWEYGNAPKSKLEVIKKHFAISNYLYFLFCFISLLGCFLAFGFLFFNIHNRNIRFIKMSSPNMNNVIIFGCILSYISVFLLGLDTTYIPRSSYWAVCTGRAWCLASAFTLAYGSMFSKTWRVHQIFTNVKMKKKVIKDYQLMSVIVLFLFLDMVVLISWQIIDPMVFKEAEFTYERNVNEDAEIQFWFDTCSSQNMNIWLPILYGYKGLIMFFGCFLAWATRHVNIPSLNDSKYIGINVYIVLIVCVVSILVSQFVRNVNHNFVLISLLIVFATTTTICLVFVPKLIEFRKLPPPGVKGSRDTFKLSKVASSQQSKQSDTTTTDSVIQQLEIELDTNQRHLQNIDGKASVMESDLSKLVKELHNISNNSEIDSESEENIFDFKPLIKKVRSPQPALLLSLPYDNSCRGSPRLKLSQFSIDRGEETTSTDDRGYFGSSSITTNHKKKNLCIS